MMTFNDFVRKNKLRNKATNKINIYQVFCSIGSNNVSKYLGDGAFSSDNWCVNLHLSKGTHWLVYINEKYFDSYGCAPAQKLRKFVLKRNGHCLYCQFKIQGLTSKRDSFCATYCLYIIYLTKVIGIYFNPAVLILH